MVLVLYLIYAFIALFGCSQIKEGLNPKNLVRESFYLNNFYVLIDETFWQEGLQMQVVVNNPPDLFDPNGRESFNKMREEFEDTQFTMKKNATMIWLDAFETKIIEDESNFNISLPKTSEEWYERVKEWLITAGGRRLWELDMVWDKQNESSNHLKAFRFQVGLKNVSEII
uniref:Lipoprotein n=1 Tax=Panagrolaimus davidi TaxID=227884 RepID=A0A914PN41_9BILA